MYLKSSASCQTRYGSWTGQSDTSLWTIHGATIKDHAPQIRGGGATFRTWRHTKNYSPFLLHNMKYSYYHEKKDYTGRRQPATDRQRKHFRLHGPNWEVYYRQETTQIIGYICVIVMLAMLVLWMFSCEPK